MTGMELATAARYNLNPIVVVLNNRVTARSARSRTAPTTTCGFGISRVPEI